MPKLHNRFLSLSGIFLSEMMLVWDDMQPANSGCFGIIKISGNFPAIRSANRTNWGNTPMDSWIQGITAERRGIHRMMNQSNTGNVKQELPMSLLHFASMFLHQCLSRLGTAKRHAECIKMTKLGSPWVSTLTHHVPSTFAQWISHFRVLRCLKTVQERNGPSMGQHLRIGYPNI